MVEKVTVDLYTNQGNGAVLKLPDREYPGILIQGDSLHILCEDIAELVELESETDLRDGLKDISERLNGLMLRYQSALKDVGESTPF